MKHLYRASQTKFFNIHQICSVVLKYVKVWLNWGFEPFHVFMLAHLFLLIKGENKTTVDQVSITEIFANSFHSFHSVLEQQLTEMFYGQAEQTTGVHEDNL